MSKQRICDIIEQEERTTVSDSFGGVKVPGTKAPSFKISSISSEILKVIDSDPTLDIHNTIGSLTDSINEAELKYISEAIIRFSFLIELTNLEITSTKMKSRWLLGKITKTRPGSYENFEGDFSPGNDVRASTFDNCYEIYKYCFQLLLDNPVHLEVLKKLRKGNSRSVPYESVFTYADANAEPLHSIGNVRLVNLDDINWLVNARSQIWTHISQDSKKKIGVKSYKTDRSQTGTDQTNRAKRWEILSTDFQFASLEDCWSVERKLLESLIHFKNFPGNAKQSLIDAGVLDNHQIVSVCPVTLEELNFTEFNQGSSHGESPFQVGHLTPLKKEGSHNGDNVDWITANGNRIQGDLSIDEVREMINQIHRRMNN